MLAEGCLRFPPSGLVSTPLSQNVKRLSRGRTEEVDVVTVSSRGMSNSHPEVLEV